MIKLNPNYYIEIFSVKDEEIEDIADLITSAFHNDEEALHEGASITFDKETFLRIFGSPYKKKDVFLRAIYKPTGEIAAFLGGIPRDLRIGYKEYHCAVPAWLAVKTAHQHKGLSLHLGIKIREILIDGKYDFAYSLHETGQHGIDTSRAVVRETGMTLDTILKIKHFLIRLFDVESVSSVVKLKWYEKLYMKFFEKVKKMNNDNVRMFKTEDGPRLFELVEEMPQFHEASILHDKEDFLWHLNQPGVICSVYENEGLITGFLLAWKFTMAGFGNTIPFGWLDMVHVHNLTESQSTDLCLSLCDKAKNAGWLGLQTPHIPYFDAKFLIKGNFIKFPKVMTLDVFNNYNLKFPEKLESFYFDWR